jgi:TRAP-type mannitol/chloroaromatic compound transport system permease small subunit
MSGRISTIADILGTIVFILIFTPAFVLLSISIVPLAVTLRFLRWWNSRDEVRRV